ncbi:hypothetical protein [Solimonas variicoloris]|uniref:hypothetical protein n=1 Tax=Solimonas variicoloris TaxID=254408 RepID=UPI00037B75D6|nr:hypothetical protein [Solimonas variicoloris]
MNRFEELLAARAALWLDYADYAGALLAGGSAPWLDASALIAWQRKAQGLLRSDVVELPLGAVAAAWLAAHAPLREAMRAKRRAVFPLRTLLADEAWRAHLAELAGGLRASFAAQPLALACPSPRRWLLDAYQAAHGEAPEIDDDEVESAAVYLADFLRCFGETGVDLLLLQESAASEPGEASALAAYQPVLNVAAHYRWSAGLSAPAGRYAGGEAPLDFVVAPQPAAARYAAQLVPAAYWSGGEAPPCPPGGFRYAGIPGDAQPEAVLQRLAALR